MAPPDLGLLTSPLAVGLSLVLILPKRGWRSIPRRLRETAAGNRAYVFGPPVHQGNLQPDLFERWCQILRRDWLRLLEMGLPLYACSVWTDVRGLAARQRLASEFALTPFGFLSQRLRGQLTEEDFLARLVDAGLPPTSPKLAPAEPRRGSGPPVEWAFDWQRHLEELRSGGASQDAAIPPSAPAIEIERPEPGRAGLVITTLGLIQIMDGDQDLALALLHRPRQRFIWLYLLALEVLRPGCRTLKDDLAREMWALLDPQFRRRSLGKRMSETVTRLPAALSKHVILGEQMGLDLSGCQCDVRCVLDLAETVHRRGSSMSPAQAEDAERAIALARKEFLPGWEEIEQWATQGRGASAEIIAEVRERVSAAHITLTLALAGHLLDRHLPGRAIPYLEHCHSRRPEREDVVVILIRAYEENGQHRAAARLRDTGALDEAG